VTIAYWIFALLAVADEVACATNPATVADLAHRLAEGAGVVLLPRCCSLLTRDSHRGRARAHTRRRVAAARRRLLSGLYWSTFFCGCWAYVLSQQRRCGYAKTASGGIKARAGHRDRRQTPF